MATHVFDAAMAGIASGTINLATDTLKWMLITGFYTPQKTDTNLTTISGAEITATNYSGGFGGTGRKSAARTITTDTTANVVRVIFSGNATWTTLGGATNSTIAGAVLIKEITDNAGSKPIAWFGLNSTVTTNGSDFSLLVDSSSGNITFQL